MITWVLFLGIGLVVGVGAGLYFARLDDISNSQKKLLQQKLDLADQQLNAYKSQVAEHFLKTAALVNTMTESYKAVHEHLATGAQELCDNQIMVTQLEMPATKFLDNTASPALVTVSQESVLQEQSVVAPQDKGMDEGESSAHESESILEQFAQESTQESVAEKTTDSKQDEMSAEEQQEEPAAAVEPPSTPESLHVVENNSTSPASLKDAEHNSASTNASRIVH